MSIPFGKQMREDKIQNERFGFRDKESMASENSEGGLDFCAAGLIDSFHTDAEKPSLSGKDLLVSFLSPLGELSHQWRAYNEVEIMKLSLEEYDALSDKLESFEG